MSVYHFKSFGKPTIIHYHTIAGRTASPHKSNLIHNSVAVSKYGLQLAKCAHIYLAALEGILSIYTFQTCERHKNLDRSSSWMRVKLGIQSWKAGGDSNDASCRN